MASIRRSNDLAYSRKLEQLDVIYDAIHPDQKAMFGRERYVMVRRGGMLQPVHLLWLTDAEIAERLALKRAA